MTPRADSDSILHAVDDKPGWGLSLLLGLTHFSLIFDGIIFLPIMIGKATHTPPERSPSSPLPRSWSRPWAP